MIYVWLAAIILFVIIEVCTTQLVTVWFAIGSVAALILNACKVSFPLQIVGFLVVSAVALILTRPLVKKMMRKEFSPTNADRCVGKTAKVVEAIDNIQEKGAVKVNGIVWSARSLNGECFNEDELVKIIRIDGVKLIVDKE